MGFHVTHLYGATEANPPLTSLVGVLRELDDRAEDTEHTDVSLTHESEWCMSVFRGGHVVLANASRDFEETRSIP